MAIPLNVLIVEDSPDDVALVVDELCRAGFAPKWKRVETEPDFLAEIKNLPDIILSDYSMPQFSGIRAMELLGKSGLPIPFILISGTVGEHVAVEAMKKGVTDYLLKDRIARLGAAVRRAMQEIKERDERWRLEAKFIEAQKMEVLGQLASGVAHDFNNILAIIMGYSDLIISKLDRENPLQKYLGEIRHASERAVGLTRQLLVFSRKEVVNSVVLDLNEVVESLDKMLRRLIDENIEMRIVYEKHLGRIKADSGYIGQVLMNLVVNARDAMPNGGNLTISTWNVAFPEVIAGSGPTGLPAKALAKEGDFVVLSVKDTGTGMTAEVKEHLFEAFYTTKLQGKGTGLGLATCQTIMQLSGGYIDVLSQEGKGTTFNMYFPQVDQPLEAKSVADESGFLSRGTEILLVVEDDPSVRHLARNVLEVQGYQVLSAPNGQDALRVAREHKGKPIQLVVTDVVMPLMGGKVMAEWLKVTYPEIKILFVSGYTEDAVAYHGTLDSREGFLAKPYTQAALCHKVRGMLDAPNS